MLELRHQDEDTKWCMFKHN